MTSSQQTPKLKPDQQLQCQRNALPPFLADTWWFGLTQRLPQDQFVALAKQRKAEGFTAIQLVVGIPPEVGPLHQSAASDAGAAWDLDGTINPQYLTLARQRIATLNQIGLTAIVYGGWGHQLDWIGTAAMQQWWQQIVATLDDLDVIYCLTGELNLWIGNTNRLLPDRSTDDMGDKKILGAFNLPIVGPAFFGLARLAKRRLVNPINRLLLNRKFDQQRQDRIDSWTAVLETLAAQTDRPLLVHPAPPQTSHALTTRPDLLAAVTVQTGHDAATRNRLWRWPQEEHARANQRGDAIHFVNLEPWYEGILSQFGVADQLYAYWASMLGGASAYCYGAHGMWNVGNGKFLAHWGRQTVNEAASLTTASLLGKSHEVFLQSGAVEWPNQPAPQNGTGVYAREENGELRELRKSTGAQSIAFYPDVAHCPAVRSGHYFLPLQGDHTVRLPDYGPAVVIN